ncbi:MAG TPA: phosphoribosyltransferase family protein [Candidatus Binatia bacterium]|nr:phosphoribosyltransferase family protein [Candidatus Binatia bacterium]
MHLFADRSDAGRRLADALDAYARRGDVIVLALPRGGVPIAYEIARRLRAPLDVYVVRKLGVPGHEELAMGALASDGTCVMDDDLIDSLGIDERAIDAVIKREIEELRRREVAYRGNKPEPDIAGKTVIVVDDGLATGATMRAAAAALRLRDPAAIVAAVPVAAARTCKNLRDAVDRVVCLATPEPFHAVGLYYRNFEQTSDDEVRRLLSEAARETGRRVGA